MVPFKGPFLYVLTSDGTKQIFHKMESHDIEWLLERGHERNFLIYIIVGPVGFEPTTIGYLRSHRDSYEPDAPPD